MEAAKYLLKHGEVLNRMNILTNYFQRKKRELYREFCWFERGSKACQVEFEHDEF